MKSASQPPPSILLVEDNEQLRALTAVYLREITENVVECGCGQEALRQALERKYDLMIFDVMLPGVSGLEILKAVRRHSNQPVIMMSAVKTFLPLSLEGGANLFFLKPFALGLLTEAARRLLHPQGLHENAHS